MAKPNYSYEKRQKEIAKKKKKEEKRLSKLAKNSGESEEQSVEEELPLTGDEAPSVDNVDTASDSND